MTKHLLHLPRSQVISFKFSFSGYRDHLALQLSLRLAVGSFHEGASTKKHSKDQVELFPLSHKSPQNTVPWCSNNYSLSFLTSLER